MTCFKFSRNHWLATNNIIRMGSFSLDLRGSLVHCPAHSRISCEPKAGQLNIKVSKDEVCTTSLCHCSAVLMRKNLKQISNLKLLFQITLFFPHSPSMRHYWEPHFVLLMTLQVQGSCFRCAQTISTDWKCPSASQWGLCSSPGPSWRDNVDLPCCLSALLTRAFFCSLRHKVLFCRTFFHPAGQ